MRVDQTLIGLYVINSSHQRSFKDHYFAFCVLCDIFFHQSIGACALLPQSIGKLSSACFLPDSLSGDIYVVLQWQPWNTWLGLLAGSPCPLIWGIQFHVHLLTNEGFIVENKFVWTSHLLDDLWCSTARHVIVVVYCTCCRQYPRYLTSRMLCTIQQIGLFFTIYVFYIKRGSLAKQFLIRCI